MIQLLKKITYVEAQEIINEADFDGYFNDEEFAKIMMTKYV